MFTNRICYANQSVMVPRLLYTCWIVFNMFQSPETSLSLPTTEYLNVPESEFLPLMLQKYCYLPTKLVKILFSLKMVQSSVVIMMIITKITLEISVKIWKMLENKVDILCVNFKPNR